MARKLRLPRINRKGKLDLWNDEVVEIRDNGLWANIGYASGQWRPGIKVNWIFQYRKSTMGIPISTEERPELKSDLVIPISRASGTNTRGVWLLICTSFRLVAFTTHYERLGTRKKFWTIYFPWSMLSALQVIHEQSSFLSGNKYSLKLLFCFKEVNYLLKLGDFSPGLANRYLVSIHKLALKAKIRYTESRLRRLPSGETKETLERTLEAFKEELKTELEIDGKLASQTFFPQLKPEVYSVFITNQ